MATKPKNSYPMFPEIRGYPCMDPDNYWGYACQGHVDLRAFREQCIKDYGQEHPYKKGQARHFPEWPILCGSDSGPHHAFVRWTGFGGWTFCFPDSKGAKAITYWNADSCSYLDWVRQLLKDHCNQEHHDDAWALKLIHLLQNFFYSEWRPAHEARMAAYYESQRKNKEAGHDDR